MSSQVRILGIAGSLVPENHEKALARTTLGSREGREQGILCTSPL
jgi:hypothetical protein